MGQLWVKITQATKNLDGRQVRSQKTTGRRPNLGGNKKNQTGLEMASPSSPSADSSATTLPASDLLDLCIGSLASADQYAAQAREAAGALTDGIGRDDSQYILHGLAWTITTVEALRQLSAWAHGLSANNRFGEVEQLTLTAAFAEYLSQIFGGIPMSQGEVVRPADFGLSESAYQHASDPSVRRLIDHGTAWPTRARLAQLIAEGAVADDGLDETLGMMRDQFQRFVREKVAPHAHDWHMRDVLIPDEVVAQMSALGVFGLTVPEEFGGLGLGKTAMCVVSEELSRGYIGVGSLGTRSEIAAELILANGSRAQKENYLSKIASGEILPTAVFTEPNVGSDLASLRTRGTLDGDTYKITGAKNWITHAGRADLMTLLVRTNADQPGHKGISMLLAEKPRGTDAEPFPAPGMSGGEIEVLGYRGMKEFEIGFDGFEVPKEGLLGDVEGQGFKQLMQTFESARIQTASRAIGVALNAMDLALTYAQERKQFNKPIFAFPRVAGKIVSMAIEIAAARQLSYFAARAKDEGRRCDMEAGMAKLLAARVAWAAADNAVQIHGGNGFATEYQISRVLCDARILNIFEGAAEIQAEVIARRLMERAN
jgi:(2S)-methylsuccinyl-CoA dehydrogenase